MNREIIRLWRGPLAIWFALLILLVLTTGSAYLSLGVGNILTNMSISAAKAALIMLFFMNIRSSSTLVRIVAAAGLFWLSFMFVLSASDYLAR